MGQLVDGVWQQENIVTKSKDGKFRREASQFSCDEFGTEQSDIQPEANRYHLYISYACPWASRCSIFRSIKKLDSIIGMTTVTPYMYENGWELSEDPVNNKQFMHEIYTLSNPNYTGRVTVPVLLDKKTNKIVCNESANIIRIFNSGFGELADSSIDFYPESLRGQIDEINDFVYSNVNNGVYKCGFATSQNAYESAFDSLFSALDELEKRLSQQRYLVNNVLTEADWRLFTTLIRFDAAYVGHFKCNKKRLIDYPNLHNYMLELYQYPGVAETVNFEHIKNHYYMSHTQINPNQIVPKGPEIDFWAAHNRG